MMIMASAGTLMYGRNNRFRSGQDGSPVPTQPRADNRTHQYNQFDLTLRLRVRSEPCGRSNLIRDLCYINFEQSEFSSVQMFSQLHVAVVPQRNRVRVRLRGIQAFAARNTTIAHRADLIRRRNFEWNADSTQNLSLFCSVGSSWTCDESKEVDLASKDELLLG